MGSTFLVVRLGALGDLVHAVPAVSALRASRPDARIDWLVDARYAAFLEFVPGLDRLVVIGADRSDATDRGGTETWRFAGRAGTLAAIRALRARRYDAAVDFQGLLKSAVWSRLSGAGRAFGFAAPHARERAAAWFYTNTVTPRAGIHVIDRNLSLASALGADLSAPRPGLVVPASPIVADVRSMLGTGPDGRYAILNPGAGWPNKRWSPERFGALAVYLRERHGMPSIVLWGPAERELAQTIARCADGAALAAPATGIGDVLALARDASLFVAGDTGPLQLAAAVGTPVVGLFGPTNPARNGPWSPDDVCLSRFSECECHHKRRCRREVPCLLGIEVEEVQDAIDRRLSSEAARV